MWRIVHGVGVAAQDYFSLFGLPARYRLDVDALEATWRQLAARVHPDRYATAAPAERRVVMQWAATINEAYQVLRHPLQRARYVCELAGQPLEAESNTRMDPMFLMQQMEWREQLDEARGQSDGVALRALETDIDQHADTLQQQVAGLLDDQADTAQAAQRVREWMFVDKLKQEILAARASAAFTRH